MYDVGDGSPYAEVVFRRDFYFRVIGVGGYEPPLSVAQDEAFQCVFAVEFADRHLVFGRVPVAFVHDDDVAAMHAGVDHGVSVHAYEVGGFGVGTEHAEHVYLLGYLVIVEWYGESRH